MVGDIIRICREEEVELAHILDSYDGPCGRIHGHSYKIKVTLEGIIKEYSEMLIDFKDLKAIIKEAIPDHYYLSNSNIKMGFQEDFRDLLDAYKIDYKTYPCRTTAENMSIIYAKAIQEKLPEDVFVVNVKLWETRNSFAEWRIEDHPCKAYREFREANVKEN